MSKMQKDYDDILTLDYDAPFHIPFATAETMLFIGGESAERLDGDWNFSVDVFDTLLRKKYFEPNETDGQGRKRPVDFSFDAWEKLPVPSSWNVQQERYHYYEGTAIYTRTFDYVPNAENERVFLRIGAANYECRVWLNGTLLSRHQGGFTPFFTELTGHLRAENRLLVTVNNERRRERVPSLNFDWFNYGGISRSVELLRRPPVFVKDLFVYLKPNHKYDTVVLRAQLSEAQSGVACQFQMEALGIDTVAKTDENGIAQCEAAAQPVLWDCEHPFLYEVKASTPQHTVTDRVGLREISVDGRRVLLNGREIFLKGVCCHEESEQHGRAVTEGERLHMLQTAKELGCNIVRLSHYPHSERMAQLADSLGLLLWEEIPVYWAIDFENPSTYADAANQMQELIVRDRNRASVAIWSVGNENPDSDARLAFMTKLVRLCKALDPSRLVSAACLVNVDAMRVQDRLAQALDIVAFNEYYGWYYRDYQGLADILDRTQCEKPLVISETGAGAAAGHFGPDEELFTEEHQAKMYQKQFAIMDNKVQGVFPWILFDFRSPVRMNAFQQQRNLKGLAALNHTDKKLAFETVRRYYQTK